MPNFRLIGAAVKPAFRHEQTDTQTHTHTCKLCKYEEEDLAHFVIKCPKLEDKRNSEIVNKNIVDTEESLIHSLFKQRKYQETGKMLKSMWYKRKYLLERNVIRT